MLIRKPQGKVFHIVSFETMEGQFFVSLCGMMIENESLANQSVAEWPYSRCWTCQKIQNDHFKSIYIQKH